MSNLKKETLDILKENGKDFSDVVWVGNKNGKIPLSLFLSLSDVEYDDGYGSEEVSIDLLVVGKGFWLERHDYDGSEWWEFKQHPKQPSEFIYDKSVIFNREDW